MVWKVSRCSCTNPLCNIWKRDRESTQRCWADLYACRSPMPSCSALLGGMACACSVGLRHLQSPWLSQPIGLGQIKGVGGGLEALPAGVGPLPTIPLQLNPDFSTPLVCIRDQSGGMEDFRPGMGGIYGDIAAVGMDNPPADTNN